MNALTLFFIMKLGTISSLLFWGSFTCLGYILWQYACLWWNTPMENESGWNAFWARKRKRAALAAVCMLVTMIMPSTREAVIMTVVPAVAQHSIWDRLLGNGVPRETAEQARKWLQDNSR